MGKRKIIIGKNDLLSQFPEVAKEWNYEKNNPLKPTEVTSFSNKKVWWKCSKCGNEWEAKISLRSYDRGCPKCAQIKRNTALSIPKKSISFKIWCLVNERENLLKEWDYERNKDYDPNSIAPMSDKVVWWKCDRNHSWKTAIKQRTARGSGCPICNSTYKTSFPEQAVLFYINKHFDTESRIKIGKYEIDIFISKYKIGIEYDGKYYHKNKEKQDNSKTIGLKSKGIDLIRIKESDHNCVSGNCVEFCFDSHYLDLDYAIKETLKILSKKTGREINEDVNTKRDNLEILKNYWEIYQKQSLANKYPEIAKEWDYEKNNGLTPEQFTQSSGEKVWWKCENGHSYKAAIYSRTHNHSGCPVCRNQKIITGENDFVTLYPAIAKEWDYEKNIGIDPNRIAPTTGKKVWWKCGQGHSWQTTVASRTSGKTGCPVCSNKTVWQGYNDLLTKDPELAKQWNYEKNGSIKPSDVAISSKRKVWWKCDKGHEWEAAVGTRAKNGHRCPFCVGQKVLVGFNDFESRFPEIAKEWNYKMNNGLLPSGVTYGSGKKVWWKCSVCGNEWKTSVYGRSKGTGCPVCAKKKRTKKENT